jgi:hypothetical protein
VCCELVITPASVWLDRLVRWLWQTYHEPLPEIPVHRETYIRGNKNKKKVKQAYFPPEAPESSSDQYEAGNAKRSLHDLSSESPKECSLIGISESCDRAKNDGGANQAEKHSIARDIPKKRFILSWFLTRRPS